MAKLDMNKINKVWLLIAESTKELNTSELYFVAGRISQVADMETLSS